MNYIETGRLILRSWKPEDLPLFAEMNKDSRVMRYFPATLSDAETEAFYNRIQSEFDSKGWGLYAVEIKSTCEFIGYVGLHEIGFDADFTPGVEIGWRLAADYHNQGYATEIAQGMIDYARDQGAEKVTIFVSKGNIRSNRVAVKCGGKIVGESTYKKRGTDMIMEDYLYEILL